MTGIEIRKAMISNTTPMSIFELVEPPSGFVAAPMIYGAINAPRPRIPWQMLTPIPPGNNIPDSEIIDAYTT